MKLINDTPPPTRQCCDCDRVLPLSEFHKNKSDRLGVTRICKHCACARSRLHAQKNPELNRARVAEWLKANKERAKARHRQWEKDNPNKVADLRSRTYRAMCTAAAAGDTRAAEKLARRRQQTKDRQKRTGRAQKYGMTLEQWNALLSSQGERCACCGSDNPHHKTGWHTDHDHETGEVRGIVCARCNRNIGNLGDNAASVREHCDRFLRYLSSVPERMAAAGLSHLTPAKPRAFRPSPVRTFELPPLEPIVHAHPSAFPEPFIPC